MAKTSTERCSSTRGLITSSGYYPVLAGCPQVVLGFYPSVAPVTVAHILQLVRLGGYNTNEIFRVDKGFVAQVQGVDGGRRAPMSKGLRAVAKQTVRDEFSSTLQHKRGVLSMGKFEEPHTGTSSFSMMLGDAPSLDGKYTIFGRVVAGDHVLSQLEQLETRREGAARRGCPARDAPELCAETLSLTRRAAAGIFVKPKERVEVVSAVLMHASDGGGLELHECEEQKTEL